MAVEIHVLSGVRNRERIFFDGTYVRVGGDPSCDLVFDPQLDRWAKDRAVVLRMTGDGWQIESTGTGEVRLNQACISGQMPIRSGDVVRFSELGPDFLFAIVPEPVTAVADERVVPAIGTAIGTGNGQPFVDGTVSAGAEDLSRSTAPRTAAKGRVAGRNRNRDSTLMWAAAGLALGLALVLVGWCAAYLYLTVRQPPDTLQESPPLVESGSVSMIAFDPRQPLHVLSDHVILIDAVRTEATKTAANDSEATITFQVELHLSFVFTPSRGVAENLISGAFRSESIVLPRTTTSAVWCRWIQEWPILKLKLSSR